MPAPQLAQLNIARAIAPLDSAELQPFMDAIDGVNAVADAAPGFVWRLEEDDDEHPGATGIRAYDDPWLIVNLSVWESREALWDFAYGGDHLDVMRRRREWFSALPESHLVLWWVPAGTIPTVEEAVTRLDHLRKHGPTPRAFSFKQAFEPGEPTAAPLEREIADR